MIIDLLRTAPMKVFHTLSTSPTAHFLLMLSIVLCLQTLAHAQSNDDLLRVSSTNNSVSARASALGTSFMGIADDAAAVALNPAGLSQLRFGDLSFALGMYRLGTDINYKANSSSTEAREIMPSYAAISHPFRIGSGRAGFSLMVNYDESLRSEYSLEAFNPNSSIVPIMLKDIGASLSDNLLYQVYVADIDSSVMRLVSPVNDSLQQRATISQSGGRGSVLAGMGFELSPAFSIGVTLGSRWSDYSYSRSYSEQDVLDVYNRYDLKVPRSNIDLNRLQVDDRLHQTSSAFDIRFSLMAKIDDWARLSFSMSPPLRYRIQEDYSRAASASYDPKPDSAFTYQYSYINDYSLSSPWDLGLAAAVIIKELKVSAALRYRDYSSASFNVPSNYALFFTTLNDSVRSQLQEQLNLSVGAEYKLPSLPIFVRASVDQSSSAYVARISDASVTTMACGLGVEADKHIRIDLSGRWSSVSADYTLYGDGTSSTYSAVSKPSQYLLQFSYRY